ncbi:MAG: endopeptidase La [Chitinophagales bacterium]|nr:endopeptidase La [Chitinophagales bacterium]
MFNLPFGEEDVEFLPMMSIEDDEDQNKDNFPTQLPLLPLRNTVLYPGVVIPITVGRDKSIKAVKEAHKKDKLIGVVAQRDSNVEDPESKDLFQIGTLARIIKMLKMPDGSSTVIIQGRQRLKVNEIKSEDPYILATISPLSDIEAVNEKEFDATISSIKELSAQIIRMSPNIPSEASIVLKNIDNPTFLMHFISSNLNNDIQDKQVILETDDLAVRAQMVLGFLHNELQLLELKNKIQSKVKTDIEKQQKDYFLHQQLKTIQEELGADENSDAKRLREKAKTKKWSKEVEAVFYKEVEKLERMNVAAAEYSVSLNYLELLLDLPWNDYTKDNFDLKHSKEVLDKDHYGLDKIKDRILEYLAVLKLKGDMKSPILCFVGPPGVGKTSLGKSIAKALNRKYVRMSLGGLHDESEIRGHRKTYIGAMPGRIIQSIKKVQSSNPVFILDEVDKVGTDFRGDPSSALLEVLDPEQNTHFYDNYLELEYDLSKTMFIATANSLNTIQPALRDRMEIIFLSGYSVEEKKEIAKRHLVPKVRKDHGLKATQIKIPDEVLEAVIHKYTRESGVRELDRQIASIMRNAAKSVAMGEKRNATIKLNDLHQILGPQKYDMDIYHEKQPPGVAVGLAWTAVGGDILFIEASLSRGKGNLTLTGNLGDVMKESATTALSFIKANSEVLGIDVDDFEKWNVHVHVPEGATPKDGPSAGITMLSALTSAFTKRPLRPYVAMTGEITLRGKVLPVGGIKEKILAAKRAGLKEIILCKINRRDVEEISKEYIKGLQFHYVENMMDVLDIALEKEAQIISPTMATVN